MASSVVILRCNDYDQSKVSEAIHSALEHLGGITQFVKNGQTVLLKPNMLSAKAPERAITTHPAFLEAVIDEVRSAGGEVWMGDSPSGALKGVKRCWENTGFLDLAERKKIRLINFEADGTIARQVQDRKYHFAKAVLEADVVINLPKFKTHGFTLYTGAIKNLYGTLPGFQKAQFHKCYPHPKNFSQTLVDIYKIVRPQLHLMDGILGMEGNGPATGKKRKTKLIFASVDGVALDAVASSIMGFKEGDIDAIRLAGEQELGENRLESINILGELLEDVRFDDFILPSNYLIRMIPQFLLRWLGRFVWIRPAADRTLCTGCSECAQLCPVDAIEMVNHSPVMDYKKCINCLCCNESCPESAIVQRMSWLARRLG